MKQVRSLRGSTLVVTVILSMAIAVICFLFILLAYYGRNEETYYAIDKTLALNIESAMQVVFADTMEIEQSRTDSLDLFGEGSDSVAISRRAWGLFNIATVCAYRNTWIKAKTFMYGTDLPPFMNGCLYLADHQRPLYMVGKATLEGNAQIPSAGIKPAYIDQRGYSVSKIIEGNIQKSETFLPQVNIQRLNDLYNTNTFRNEIERSLNYEIASLTQSFDQPPIRYLFHGSVHLRRQKLNGNIVLISDNDIEVDSSVRLQNIILVAPTIKIKDGFNGRIQVFASKNIEIGNNCFLQYPSSLTVIADSASKEMEKISIGVQSRVQGIVLMYNKYQGPPRLIFTLENRSLVEGLIYVSGFSEIKGNIYGTVATDYFIYRTGANTYDNHLVDVEISRSKLFSGYVNSSLFRGYGHNKIIQWLQ